MHAILPFRAPYGSRAVAAKRFGIMAAAWLLASVALTPSAWAQDGAPLATATPQSDDEGADIVVSGYRFLAEDTSGATNLPVPIEEVPQAISLVSNDFIKAADLKILGEIAQYTPGAFYSGAIGGSVSLLQVRGFTTTYAFDGLTTGNISAEPDPVVVERIEIVKGPSSVVYGAASPGGVTNLVFKSASPSTPSYLSVLGGSWDRFRAEGQVAGALNAAGTVRAIAVGAIEDSDGFQDYFHLKRYTAYAGVEAEPLDSLKLYLRGEYEYVSRPGYGGFGLSANGTPPPLPRSFIFAPSDDRVDSDTYRLSAGAAWDLSSMWSIELKGNYSKTDHAGPAPLWTTALQPNGNFGVLTRNVEFHLEDWNVGAFTNLKLDNAGLPESFIAASAIYQSSSRDQFTRFPLISGASSFTSNIGLGTDGLVGLLDTQVLPGGNLSTNSQDLAYYTYSAQAVIKVAGPLSVLGGVSISDPSVRNKTVNNGPWVHFDPGNQTSYRGALLLEPVQGLNMYASYSESFQPNFRIDRNDAVLPPVIGEQYELGAKYISPGRRLLLTAALFQLDQQNTAVITTFIGADGFARYEAVGQVRHRGVELEAVGLITANWQVQAGYAHLDAKIRRDLVPANVGRQRPFLPTDTASLFTSYALDNGLFASIGVRHVSTIRTTVQNTTRPLPSYTIADASIGYTFGDRWRAQLNLKNLFDETYYLNSAGNITGGTLYGEPRSFALSLRKDF